MAASLLAGIDWDDSESWEIATVVKTLCIATQERFMISNMSKDGTFSAFLIPTVNTVSKYFPYKSSTTGLKFNLNDGDPIQDFTTEIGHLLSYTSIRCADMERWNDADDNSTTTTTRFRLSDTTTDDPTYDNRLFEVTGYTSYPDLSVYAPEEIKKWYDMLTEMKYIERVAGNSTSTGDYLIFEGAFDMETLPFYLADQEIGTGARWYTSTGGSYEDPSTTTPYSDFKTDNDALFGTVVDTYNEDTDTAGTYVPPRLYIYASVFKKDASGDYACYIQASKVTFVEDFTDRITEIGFTGRPLDYKHQQAVRITEAFPTGEDTNMSYPYSVTGDNQRFYCDVTVTQDGNKYIIKPDYDISPATFPANISDISSNETVAVTVKYSTTFYATFLEEWDGEGGFEYYTVVP